MPHRAGYFAFAYEWDHHCDHLIGFLKDFLEKIRGELQELLRSENISCVEELIHYYQKWYYNHRLSEQIFSELSRRQEIINEFIERGYGVNLDLVHACKMLKNEHHDWIETHLNHTFPLHLDFAKRVIFLSQEVIDKKNVRYIVEELCKKISWQIKGNIPNTIFDIDLDLAGYFLAMEKNSLGLNTILFRRLFYDMGYSTMTVMKGSVGHEDVHDPRYLKLTANRNLQKACDYIFDHLHLPQVPIDNELLKELHFILTQELTLHVGKFRPYDFIDRNGVTFQYGNFNREIEVLDHVLKETQESFDDFETFVYNLAKSYYFILAIHPFEDGNGRLAKCFLNYMLIRKGLPPIDFDESAEIFALPRYGGSPDDMYAYLKRRIKEGVKGYLYQKAKLQELGLLELGIENILFDSGIYFSRIIDYKQENIIPKIQVSLNAYVIEDEFLRNQYDHQAKIVFSCFKSLEKIAISCGFAKNIGAPWETMFQIEENIYIRLKSELDKAKVYDVDIRVDVPEKSDKFFCLCVMDRENNRVFNNQNLNYNYEWNRAKHEAHS